MKNELKKLITTNAPQAIGPYSQGVFAGGLLFLSGSIPLAVDGDVVAGSVSEQTTQVMKNIKALLEAAGVGFDSVVKTTCFLTDMADFAEFNAVYAEYFTTKPARSTVAVAGLPRGVKVEVEVIAVVNQ